MILDEYIDLAKAGYTNYADYLWNEITHPHWQNYFYWLTGLSLVFFALEVIRPWRREQPKFRQDFWLDAFYMYFNYFLFSLIIFSAGSNVVSNAFNDFLGLFGITNMVAFHLETWPAWAQMLTLFVVSDFLAWNVHRLLHRVPWLWEFHKVHHSVEQMGFAAHLRYHWMENVIYKSLQYIPLSMLGFGLVDFFLVYILQTAWGHFNHSNLQVNLGPLKYIFNSPRMHIWHHAHDLPENRRYGMNFGITLSLWDWLFGTVHWPSNGRDIRLGFPGLKRFPKRFFGQVIYGFRKRS